MSKELEDGFGRRVIYARNTGIRDIKELITTGEEFEKSPSDDTIRLMTFLDTLTPSQKEEVVHAMEWGLTRSFFNLMVFFTQGEGGFDVKLEGYFKGENEVLTDTRGIERRNVIFEEEYFDWDERWGNLFRG